MPTVTIDRLVDFIRSHDFRAHSYNGHIEACMTGVDANGNEFEEWSTLPAAQAAVRQWLGY